MKVLGKHFEDNADGYWQAAEHIDAAGFHSDARDFRAYARELYRRAWWATIWRAVGVVLIVFSLTYQLTQHIIVTIVVGASAILAIGTIVAIGVVILTPARRQP